jgi:hypothetical protein
VNNDLEESKNMLFSNKSDCITEEDKSNKNTASFREQKQTSSDDQKVSNLLNNKFP